MASSREFEFAEVLVDKLFLESFPNERSPFHATHSDKARQELADKFVNRLRWHIGHSLSKRQKEVLRLYLKGKKEREIARELGITQQVVNIYKQRAIKKLQSILAS